jgi:hypothetical protein
VTPLLIPWQFMLLTLAGWISRSQRERIECLRAENQVLAEQLKGKTDAADGRAAAKAGSAIASKKPRRRSFLFRTGRALMLADSPPGSFHGSSLGCPWTDAEGQERPFCRELDSSKDHTSSQTVQLGTPASEGIALLS